jgi:hypothetical protein
LWYIDSRYGTIGVCIFMQAEYPDEAIMELIDVVLADVTA